jgi:hypothetical protein
MARSVARIWSGQGRVVTAHDHADHYARYHDDRRSRGRHPGERLPARRGACLRVSPEGRDQPGRPGMSPGAVALGSGARPGSGCGPWSWLVAVAGPAAASRTSASRAGSGSLGGGSASGSAKDPGSSGRASGSGWSGTASGAGSSRRASGVGSSGPGSASGGGRAFQGRSVRVCSALSRPLPWRPLGLPAVGLSGGAAGNGTVLDPSPDSAISRSIRSASPGPRRRAGTWSSSPLITGHSAPARLGGSGSSFTTAIRVGRAPARS